MEATAMVDPFEGMDDEELNNLDYDEEAEAAMDEHLEEARKRWTPQDDSGADWVLRKIAELDADDKKWEDHFGGMLQQIKNANARRRDYWKQLLAEYFSKVPHKESKTQATYTLPNGKLVLKQNGPKFKPDDETLVPWLKENKLQQFVKVEESARWGDFKKTLPKDENGDLKMIRTDEGWRLIDENGEIVPGVSVEPQDPTFSYSLTKR